MKPEHRWRVDDVRIDDELCVAHFVTPVAEFIAESPAIIREVLAGEAHRCSKAGDGQGIAALEAAERALIAGLCTLAERQHALLSVDETLRSLRAELSKIVGRQCDAR